MHPVDTFLAVDTAQQNYKGIVYFTFAPKDQHHLAGKKMIFLFMNILIDEEVEHEHMEDDLFLDEGYNQHVVSELRALDPKHFTFNIQFMDQELYDERIEEFGDIENWIEDCCGNTYEVDADDPCIANIMSALGIKEN